MPHRLRTGRRARLDNYRSINAVAENFFATLKKELIYPHVWPTRRSVRAAIFSFIEGWYNRAHLHSTLDYSSPNAYEEDYHRLIAAA